MKRIYVPTTSPNDWRRFLAEPEIQWRKGYSARELAECWEQADGFPSSVKQLFTGSPTPAIHELELLLAIPEYKVDLPPEGGRPSQNDLFILARASDGKQVVIMVEGKVSETFGPTLGTWLMECTPGKLERLEFLCRILGLKKEPPPEIRYQLLHRTASAILAAQQFNAAYAMMIVQSFSQGHAWLEDYQAFLGLYGVNGDVGQLTEIPGHKHPQLYAGWVSDKPR
jgi:Domain of unknown function (DUF6946)